MRPANSMVLFFAATLLSSCAPYIGTCSWVAPEAADAIKVVEVRKPIPGECDCIGCDAPGRFLLQRDEYTIEFWNGDRWYTQLHVRARGADGKILTLTADTSEFRRMAPHVPERDTRGFEYFMHFAAEDSKRGAIPMTLTVVDAEGRVLGIERVGLRVTTRKDLGIEAI